MKILDISAFASIQDLGRFGHRKHGIGTNGAMDPWALQLGNALLQNPLNAPALEITLGGLVVEFTQDSYFCLTGACYQAELTSNKNGKSTAIYQNWRYAVKKGDKLTLKRAICGMHAYLCVQGGFAIPTILNSASTNSKANFGGYQGRFLAKADEIPIHASSLTLSNIAASPFFTAFDDVCYTDVEGGQDPIIIRVMPNSEFDAFDELSQQTFCQTAWRVSSQSNHMGYRLDKSSAEQSLTLKEPLQMNSHGVDMGMIQVPPQGEPIVLMADAQTTGGYPKIASVIAADIGRFAQLRFGQYCRFRWVDAQQAITAKQQRHQHIKLIEKLSYV